MNGKPMRLHSAREKLCALHLRIAESDDPKQMRLLMQREVISVKARVYELKGALMDDVARMVRKEVSHD